MELLYVFPPKLQSRGRERSTSVQLNTMLWDAADEDHRAASEMQPTFSPGLTEEVELRAGMNKKDHLLGGPAALPWTPAADAQLAKLLTNSDWSRQTKISDSSLKNGCQCLFCSPFRNYSVTQALEWGEGGERVKQELEVFII